MACMTRCTSIHVDEAKGAWKDLSRLRSVVSKRCDYVCKNVLAKYNIFAKQYPPELH